MVFEWMEKWMNAKTMWKNQESMMERVRDQAAGQESNDKSKCENLPTRTEFPFNLLMRRRDAFSYQSLQDNDLKYKMNLSISSQL